MNLKHPILFLLAFFTGFLANSQTIEFVENKGQWDSRVLYAGRVPGGHFFIHKDGYTVLQNNEQDMAELEEMAHTKTLHGKPIPSDYKIKLRSHAYTVQFEDANKAVNVVADKPLPTFNNYFIGNDPSKWASGCRVFQGITINNLYEKVDIRFYSERGTLKYDLIVKPGGRVSDITLKYEGADKLQVKNKELHIGTSVGVVKELSPYTYQYNQKGREEVPVRFNVTGNKVKFIAKEYNKDAELIIDPNMIFCSLSGSNADNWGFTATYGPDGSFFGGGIVFGQGFPVSPGAAQTGYSGGASGCLQNGFDIGIIKLSADGSTRLYATYIGGAGNEMPQSLICTPQGELIIAGRTNSPISGGSYPVTAPKIGPDGAAGNWDIAITKLSANGGTLIGSRRIGGTADDGANINPCGASSAQSLQQNYGDESRSEVNIDANGNIYLASCTRSSDFPIQNGFQNTFGGGQDGVVLKFNPNLTTLLFSSYLGGSQNDATYVLALNPSNNDIFVAGGTESANLPGNRAGTVGDAKPGGIDGFISVISNDGSTIRRTTFIGTPAIDQIYGIQFDRIGFPYIMGQTTGNMPIINAQWGQPNGRQFIAKLQPDLSDFVYRTTVGKGAAFPDFSPVAFLVDRCENVYVSGWGGRISNYNNSGVQGLPTTADAFKQQPDLNQANGLGQDFYFFVLERNAVRQLYGSYFGQNAPSSSAGDHVDGGTSRFDQNGVIYQAICANCGNNQPYPTFPAGSVWAASKPANVNCNLAMVKIEFDFAGVGSGVQSSIMGVPRDTAGCVPLTVDFKDTLLQAVRYYWNFGDGSPMVSTTKADTSHTYIAVGEYRVMLIAEDSTTCNIRDTSYLTIKVGASEAKVDFIPRKIDTCTLFRFQFENTSIAPAGFPFAANSFEWDFGDKSPRIRAGTANVVHTYANPGTYRVKLYLRDTTYCNAPDSIEKEIRVSPFVKANFNAPKTGCAPLKVKFDNTSSGGMQFIWNFGDGNTSNDVSPEHTFPAGSYTITLTAIDSGSCNIVDVKTLVIDVLGQPTADFAISPQPPTVNMPIAFSNLSSADAVRFKWFFGDGDSLITTSRNVVEHEYNATGTFNACLVAINSAGCLDTLCRDLRTQVEPAVDVPNAFTPLSNDRNNQVFVRGFGIARMKFTIYTRQGEKVFETNDKRIGWDGRFKGKLLPGDVYAYTLDVEFFDKTKAIKTGDITLIR